MGRKTPQTFLELFQASKSLRYKKGDIIIQPSEVPPGIFYIKSGHVRVRSFAEWGEEKLFIIYKAEEMFPIFWAIDKLPVRRFYEAMDDVELWRVDRVEFLEFIKSHPETLFEVTRRITAILYAYVNRVENLEYTNSYARLISLLLGLIDRFGEKKGSRVIIKAPLTHTDIAASIAITRETVSRELEKLEKKEIISYLGHYIVINNTDKLKKEMSEHYDKKLM